MGKVLSELSGLLIKALLSYTLIVDHLGLSLVKAFYT